MNHLCNDNNFKRGRRLRKISFYTLERVVRLSSNDDNDKEEGGKEEAFEMKGVIKGEGAEIVVQGWVDILIVEKSISETYGLFLWPSSFILSKYIYDNFIDILSEHQSILELGAGTSLPSLLLIKLVETIKENAQANVCNIHQDSNDNADTNDKDYEKQRQYGLIEKQDYTFYITDKSIPSVIENIEHAVDINFRRKFDGLEKENHQRTSFGPHTLEYWKQKRNNDSKSKITSSPKSSEMKSGVKIRVLPLRWGSFTEEEFSAGPREKKDKKTSQKLGKKRDNDDSDANDDYDVKKSKSDNDNDINENDNKNDNDVNEENMNQVKRQRIKEPSPTTESLFAVKPELKENDHTKVTKESEAKDVKLFSTNTNKDSNFFPFSETCPSLIIGADVIYHHYDMNKLFSTLSYFFLLDPSTTFLTVYQDRGMESIFHLLKKWNLSAEILPLPDMNQVYETEDWLTSYPFKGGLAPSSSFSPLFLGHPGKVDHKQKEKSTGKETEQKKCNTYFGKKDINHWKESGIVCGESEVEKGMEGMEEKNVNDAMTSLISGGGMEMEKIEAIIRDTDSDEDQSPATNALIVRRSWNDENIPLESFLLLKISIGRRR